MSFYKALEEEVKALTVKEVNKVIKTYFKPIETWTLIHGGDFKTVPIKTTTRAKPD
jgi:zinc protease